MLKRITNDFSLKQEGSFTKEFGFKTTLKTRYVKMIAKNFGVCPEWHLGAGGKSWIFIDEINRLFRRSKLIHEGTIGVYNEFLI